MHQIDFNDDSKNFRSRKTWDSYQAFHKHIGPFVLFETGELMITHEPKPDVRQMYDNLGIQLTTTSDQDCPDLYLNPGDENPVTKAWLRWRGQQYLAIDHERGVAVAIRTGWSRSAETPFSEQLPTHLEYARALWTGPKRLPVPLVQVSINPPDKEIKKDLADKLDEVRAACAALDRMSEKKNNPYRMYYSAPKAHVVDLRWRTMQVEDILADIVEKAKTNHTLMPAIATQGFVYPRQAYKQDYLYIKK